MSRPGGQIPPQAQQGPGGLPPPPGGDAEAGQVRPESNFRGLSDVQKWQKEDWMKKGALVLIFRASALLFSFLCFMLIVTVPNFTTLSDACFGFSVSLIVMLYTAVFVGIKGHEIRTGEVVIPQAIAVWLDFIGDQVLALFLFAAASVGASEVTQYRQLEDENPYYTSFPYLGQYTAAVAMAFLAFFSLEPAALISTYHFSLHISKSL